MEKEQWKTIDGYENYMVSDWGRIMSLNYNGTGKARIMKPYNAKAYLVVDLVNGNGRKPKYVHILVAQAFIPNPNNLPEVNHIDEDGHNNHVGNLEWCTELYNNRYGTRIERAAKSRINHPKRSKPVIQYSLDGELVKEYPSASEVERQLGIRQQSISRCCLGQRSTCHGYIWRYKK